MLHIVQHLHYTEMKPKSPFVYSDTNKRYHIYDYYLKHKYGTKCARIPIDAGFSCPNRDGDGSGGCIYCSVRGAGDFCASALLPPEVQFARGYAALRAKWQSGTKDTSSVIPAIPYFQAFSNTYAPLGTLKAVFDAALSYRDADGNAVYIPAMAIATRPDCLPPQVVSYLAALNTRCDVTVELGLQSAHDRTLSYIGRGHDFRTFLDGYHRLKEAGLSVCVHIINGLPGEDADDMTETARILGKLRPDFVKLHMLHVLAGTRLAELWAAGDVPLLSQEEYTATVCRQLTLLPPETVICRLTGDGAAGDLLAPLWTKNKRAVIAAIDKTLAREDRMQGDAFCI